VDSSLVSVDFQVSFFFEADHPALDGTNVGVQKIGQIFVGRKAVSVRFRKISDHRVKLYAIRFQVFVKKDGGGKYAVEG